MASNIMKLLFTCATMVSVTAFGAVKMPQIVSHRGESLDRPENTMAAFQLAFERGVDGVECDVYATADGVPVIIHDSTTGRTAGSSVDLTVTDSTWDQLKDVQVGQFGSWASTEWATQTIPKLEDYLALLSENETTVCVVELKGNGANNLVASVVAAVQAQPLATKDRVVFIAFDASLISAVRQALPDYPAWLLLSNVSDNGATLVSKIEACGATGVDIQFQAASCSNPDDIATVKNAGYTFAVWTCDSVDTAWTITQNGVESITTNKGGAMKTAIAALVADATSHEEMIDLNFPAGVTVVDAGAYAQNGLVGHFDGIRNAGLDQPHDPNARTWKNLVSGAPDAAFYYNNAVTQNGYWNGAGTGFYFPDNVCARLTDGITLGTYPTVQLAVDINIPAQTAGGGCYKCVFHEGTNTDDPSLFFNHTKDNTSALAHTLTLKADKYADSNNSDSPRPTVVLPDQFKYATVMLGNDRNYLFSGTEPGSGTKRSKTNAMGAMKFSWGGVPYDTKRMLKGTYYSVRMYNRNLTEGELVWNRILDDVRFRGVMTNGCVVVASNRLGLEGNEANGAYFVNGSHTFTAPESATVDGNEYSCVGYKLEYWDTSKSAWNIDGEYEGNQCEFTRCASVAGMRITWNWKLKNGVKKYDADDYVQAGLLINFDGIRNAGLDKDHDFTATTWKNLGTGSDATLATFDTANPGKWAATGYDFNAGDCFVTDRDVTLFRQATVQFAVEYIETVQTVKWPSIFGPANIDNDRFNFYTYTPNSGSGDSRRGDCLQFNSNNVNSKSIGLQPWDGRFGHDILDYNRSSHSSKPSYAWTTGEYVADVGTYKYGIGSAQSSAANRKARAFTGVIHTVRLYDRVLSEAELKHNSEVDYCRFYGTAGRSTETDLVEVRSEVPGIELEEAGGWLVRGTGTKTFTAPATANYGFCTYSCAGYRTETWDAASRQWINPVVTSGATSCAIAGTTGAANRRITWLWTLTKGIRSAADYDVYDYVQQGLVAHYDAIRNRGASNVHALKGMYWLDLSYRDNLMIAASNTCYASWTENAYRFTSAGASNMRMTETINLGRECSFQSVMDTTPASQTVNFPTYFGTSNDAGMFTRWAGDVLEWKCDDWCVDNNNSYPRPKLSAWQGKYINGIVTSSKVYLVQGSSLNYSVKNKGKGPIDNRSWSVGGSCYEDPKEIAKRALTGDFFSQRYYNRPLTEAELAQNLKVDEIRHRGNFASYRDVVVVNEQPVEGATVESSVPDGEYEVTDQWTFTADEVVVNGRTYKPRYTLETWDGAGWGTPVRVIGNSYTHTKGDTPVRITWKWTLHQATTIILQ